MSNCSHINFLEVESGEPPLLCDSGRHDRILSELQDPSQQNPSLLYFIGGREKETALAHLFTPIKKRRGAREGGNGLYFDASTVTTDCPILLAESDLALPKAKSPRYHICHRGHSYRIQWPAELNQRLWTILHARLFFLFAEVICIFSEDLGGIPETIEYLKSCASYSSASSAPRQIRPRVVIVCHCEEDSTTSRILEIEESRYRLLQDTGHDLQASFSEISILQLPGDHCSLRTRYRTLQEKLLRHAEQMRQIRRSCSYLFSARHLSCFMEQAVRHTSESITRPFDFILESRKLNPVDKAFSDHLSRFVRLSTKLMVPYDATTKFIASAVLRDAYPPGMHSKLLEDAK